LYLSLAISLQTKTVMKFKDIPQAVREARRRLVEKWMRARSAEERDALIPRVPNIVPAVTAWLRRDAREIEINAKASSQDKEIGNLSRQAAEIQAQVHALDVKCQERNARNESLRKRLADIKEYEARVPQLAADICAALGFDLSSREEILKENQPKPN